MSSYFFPFIKYHSSFYMETRDQDNLVKENLCAHAGWKITMNI